jgi:ParB-like chromosome segregation protein Spo0J
MLSICKIITDAGTQIRGMVNADAVDDYAAAMEAGAEFPPVVVFHDGNRHILADGFHRILAAERIGRKEIGADIRKGTAADALWFALGANKANGLRLSHVDKASAIHKALREFPDKSQRAIAEQVGCSVGHVCGIAKQLFNTEQLTRPDRVTRKNGGSYPSTRPAKPTEPTEATAAEPTPAKPEPVNIDQPIATYERYDKQLRAVASAKPMSEWPTIARVMRDVADWLDEQAQQRERTL